MNNFAVKCRRTYLIFLCELINIILTYFRHRINTEIKNVALFHAQCYSPNAYEEQIIIIRQKS